MSGSLPLIDPPTWAYNYCYFFYFLAMMQFLIGMYGIFLTVGKAPVVAAILLMSLIINVVTTLMIFWMCRSSLRYTGSA